MYYMQELDLFAKTQQCFGCQQNEGDSTSLLEGKHLSCFGIGSSTAWQSRLTRLFIY